MEQKPFMLLNSSIMKIVVTTHVALKDVSDGISIEKLNKTKIFDQSLKKTLELENPK